MAAARRTCTSDTTTIYQYLQQVPATRAPAQLYHIDHKRGRNTSRMCSDQARRLDRKNETLSKTSGRNGSSAPVSPRYCRQIPDADKCN